MLKSLICVLLLMCLAIAATEARRELRKLLEDEDEDLEERLEIIREALDVDKAAEELEDRELDDDEAFGTGRASRR